MPNMSKQYQLILGTFIDNEFIWHDVDSFDTLEEGYKEFKKYVNSQLKYTDEELVKVWNSGRLDIELRRGNRLLNWVGIYVREVDKLSEDEEEKANEENPEKKEKKDAKDSVPKSNFTDSDADFDHLIEWDTNEEWLNHLSPEDKEKLFTLGLNVKRHLKFHAFPETVRVNKDKNIVFPYKVPFDKWLKEKCTFFEGEW